jgi:hypothetical protein
MVFQHNTILPCCPCSVGLFESSKDNTVQDGIVIELGDTTAPESNWFQYSSIAATFIVIFSTIGAFLTHLKGRQGVICPP